MPNQIETKSILAKLLATEDISVEHDAKAPTAAFDVKNRKLYLPMWKDMSNDLYDLFVGHEVGHAHETPEEGWHDTVIDNPSLKSFLNIIEDARIERKVKQRYPGLVKSFHRGYQELFDKDFFGVKNRNLETLPFVDRVNLHFKIGHLLGLKFSETEQNFLDRVAKTETWEDVELLANELADISKQEAEDREDELEPLQQMMDDLMSQMDDAQEQQPDWNDYQPDHMKQEESEEGEGEGEGQGEEKEDPNKDEWGNPKPGTPGGSQGEEESDEDYQERREQEWQEENKKRQEERARRNAEWEAEEKAKELFENDTNEVNKKKEELAEAMEEVSKMKDFLEGEGQKSITDDEFRKNESELVDVDAKPIQYVSPQKMFKAKDWIVPMNELYNWNKSIELKQWDENQDDYYYNEIEVDDAKLPEIANKLYQEFVKETAPIIGSMAQQFELKKAASANKKAREAKSGDLNEDKLWAYKLTEDLFQKNTIVPNGKNHGIIMYVDLSGSMHRQMEGTLEQMMNMAMFCRKVNIPFDVYGFSNNRPMYDNEDESIDTSPWSENKDVNRKAIKDAADGEMLMTDKNFALVHMLSSTCKKSEFINAMSYLLLMKIGYSRASRYYADPAKGKYYGYITNEYFRLGGTPLNSAILMATEVAKTFQKAYNVELLTTIFLTDGGATDSITFRNTSRDTEDRVGTDHVYSEAIAIKDGAVVTRLPAKTGYSRRDNVTTQTLLEHYKRVTGSTLLNFHIVDGKRNDFYSEYESDKWMEGKDSNHWETNTWVDTVWKDVLKNKFTTTTPAFGYDCRFLLKGQKDLNVGTEELTVKSNKKGDLLRGFRNFNKNKKTSRTFLNQIIDLVA
jgi:hypothetical protein